MKYIESWISLEAGDVPEESSQAERGSKRSITFYASTVAEAGTSCAFLEGQKMVFAALAGREIESDRSHEALRQDQRL